MARIAEEHQHKKNKETKLILIGRPKTDLQFELKDSWVNNKYSKRSKGILLKKKF